MLLASETVEDRVRIRHQTADSERPDVMRRIEHGRKRAHVMQPTVLADPAEFGPPCDHFNLGICFMQKGRGFQSTLPSSDDCYSLS